jgi:outer membrane receptor protein involved in Fe transport
MNRLWESALLAIGTCACLGVSLTAWAQQAPSAAGSLEEIVVTANKREENIEKVGLTVTAISGEQLAEQRITSLQDVAAAVPGLSFSATTTNTPIFTLRGVGYNGNSLGAYPAVSVYVDEAPLPFPVMASHSAFDLQRIEVLKGPQGTLFGENSTGGAINYIAAKPTDHFQAGGDLSYGRFNSAEENLYVSGPVGNTVAARLAITALNEDGWQHSTTRPGDTNGSFSYFAGRLITTWKAAEGINLSLNVNGWIDKSQPQAPQFVAMTPASPTTPQPQQLSYPFPAQNPQAADWSITPYRPMSDRKFYQASLRGDIDLPRGLILTSITSYDNFQQTQKTDVDGTALALEDLLKDDGYIHTFSQEVRVAGAGTSYRWIVGGNYEKSTTFENEITNYIDDSEYNAANLFINQSGNTVLQDLRNVAAFANGEYDISPLFTIRGGARYTDAKDSATICGYSPGDGQVATLFNILGNLLGTVPFTPIGPNDCYTLNQNNVPGEPFKSTLKQHNVSWRVGLDYHLNDSTLLYTNISRGFKAGSYPSLSAANYAQLQPVTQESVTSYEVGVKASFLDRRVQLNAATFYYDYKDKQIEGKEADPIFTILNILVNVPKSRVLGAESDLTVEPLPGVVLNGSVTYLDSRIQDYTGINVLAQQENFAGERLPFTPLWSGRINADYRPHLAGGGTPFVGFSVDAQSSSETVPGGGHITIPASPVNRVIPGVTYLYQINPRATMDARLGYESEDGRWKVMLWGKNILDKYYWTNVVTSNDATARFAGRPATYGITFGFKVK